MINTFYSPQKKFVSLKLILKRTHSNVFISISGANNHIFKTFSTGLLGFKNTKKDTPYAAEALGKAVGRYILSTHNNQVAIIFKSPIDGRIRAVLRGLSSFGSLLYISGVYSKFSPAHNGCRPRKTRRV